jgi:hypothetical protein
VRPRLRSGLASLIMACAARGGESQDFGRPHGDLSGIRKYFLHRTRGWQPATHPPLIPAGLHFSSPDESSKRYDANWVPATCSPITAASQLPRRQSMEGTFMVRVRHGATGMQSTMSRPDVCVTLLHENFRM